jgi:hypothetical protein
MKRRPKSRAMTPPTSLSASMISPDYNLNPVIEAHPGQASKISVPLHVGRFSLTANNLMPLAPLLRRPIRGHEVGTDPNRI